MYVNVPNYAHCFSDLCSYCFPPNYWRFITCSCIIHERILSHTSYWNFFERFCFFRQGTYKPKGQQYDLEKYSTFQNIHVSFLRTVPPYSHQADVWVEVLKHFKYKKVIFIHSSDTDGRALLGRFQTTSQSLEDDVEIKVQVKIISSCILNLLHKKKTNVFGIFVDQLWREFFTCLLKMSELLAKVF